MSNLRLSFQREAALLHDTIILDVGYRDITRKADGKQFRIYEITDAQGTKWTTNRKDIAGEANRLINKRVEISGRIEEKGVYTNHYLDDLRAVDGQQSPVGTRIAQAEPSTTSSSGFPGSNVTITGGQITPSGPTDRDWSIWRQTATKVAASLSTGATEFWRNVDDLIAFYAHGQKPGPTTAPPETTALQETTALPQPSAASPPGEYQSFSAEPDRPQFDSDIPF